MKLINRKEQQYCGNRFTAAPLRKILENMGARNIPGNPGKLRCGYTAGSSSQKKSTLVTRRLNMAKKRKLESANDAKIESSQESLTKTEVILPGQESAFDEIAMYVKEALSSEGDLAGIVPFDHPLVIAYISSCRQGNRLIYASPQIARLGLNQEAWFGKTDLRLQQVHEGDHDRLAEAIRYSSSTGEKFNCRYRLYDSNRKIRWYHDEASVVCDKSGVPLFIRGVMLDITDKEEMGSELNQHRYCLEQHVESRTGQIMRRMALLESCNTTLGGKLALARMEITALKQQLAAATEQSSNCPEQLHDFGEQACKIINSTRSNWIAHGCYKPDIKECAIPGMQLSQTPPATQTGDDTEQLDGISDWARNMIGWRMAAAGVIA